MSREHLSAKGTSGQPGQVSGSLITAVCILLTAILVSLITAVCILLTAILVSLWAFYLKSLGTLSSDGQSYAVLGSVVRAIFTTGRLDVLVELVTAVSTFGLFVVTLVAVMVTYCQFISFQRSARVQTTTDLLREWSKQKYQRILEFIDYGDSPEWCRRYARLLYRLLHSDVQRPIDKETRKLWREKRGTIDNAIQDLSLLATRTWNLLKHNIIDKDVLFGQIDYDIIAAYFELEDVLAIRQVEDDFLYSDFTSLARAAQKHYKDRPTREVIDEFVDATFQDLPFEEDEFAVYLEKCRARDKALRLQDVE